DAQLQSRLLGEVIGISMSSIAGGLRYLTTIGSVICRSSSFLVSSPRRGHPVVLTFPSTPRRVPAPADCSGLESTYNTGPRWFASWVDLLRDVRWCMHEVG